MISSLSVGIWLGYSPSLWLWIMGVMACLQSSIPTSHNKSNIYFRWDRNMLFFDPATYIPKKYRSPLRFFISKSVANSFWSLEISSIWSLMMTYTIKAVTLPCLCLKNNAWAKLLCQNPHFFMAWLNRPNHHLRDCFNPYCARCNLHTTLKILCSSEKYPCKPPFKINMKMEKCIR